jgi:RNA polymerase-binding transcription factor DksA
MFPNSKRCPCLPLWRIHACMAFLMDLRVASSLRMPRLCLRMSWLAQAAGPLFQQKNCFRTSFSCHMGSLGYAKCHWCKTEGWNFYIPDNVGGPLCGKCLRGDDPTDQKENPTDMKANVHSAAAEDRVQHRGTESTWYWTKQSNDQTGSTGRNLTPLTRSGPYTIDHVGNRGAAADPRDLSTGANLETYPRDSPYRLKHSAATDNRMPHHWTPGTLHTRRSNHRTRSTGTNLTPSTRSEPYPNDLAPDAKHQTWPQASDDRAKKMEEQKHQESDDFKRAKLDLQKTMRKVEAEYRTCWRCGHPITQVWWTTLLVPEAVLSRRPTCSRFCLLEYCSTIENNWLLEVSLDKDRMTSQLDELQKELLLQSTSPPEQPRNVATDTAPPESASRT